MRWPAGVIAQVVLDAGWNRDTAVTPVAVALAATGGDDAYIGRWPTGDRYAYVGAWAVPWDRLDPASTLNPWRLRDCARIVRTLTGPAGDDWSWSAVHRQGLPAAVVRAAEAGVASPAPGYAQDVPGPIQRLQGVTAGIDQAEAAATQKLAAVAAYDPHRPRP